MLARHTLALGLAICLLASVPLSCQRMVARDLAAPRAILHRVALDPVRGALLTYGGGFSRTSLRDTRHLDRSTWTWEAANPPTEPTVNQRFGMVTDLRRERIVLFGGNSNGSFSGTNETWEWDGASWSRVSLPTSPAGRVIPAMAYDSRREVVVLHGGVQTNGLSDTWEYDGTNWRQLFYTGAGPMGPAWMVFDPLRDVMVLLAFDGTWEWDGASWTGPLDPGRVDNDDFPIFDPTRGAVLRIGGRADVDAWDGVRWNPVRPRLEVVWPIGFLFDPAPGGGVMLMDDEREHWRLEGEEWLQVGPFLQRLTGMGPARFDPTRSRHLTVDRTGRVAARDLATGKWRVLTVADSLPVGVSGYAWDLDLARDRVVLHGAPNLLSQAGRTFLWESDTARWTEASPPHPGPVAVQGAMAYDLHRRVVVCVGGVAGRVASGNVWEWDGQDWREFAPPTGPTHRYHPGLVYDPDRRVSVLFGGQNANDTWEWDGTSWTLRNPGDPLLDGNAAFGVYHIARRRVLASLHSLPTQWQRFAEWDGDAGTWSVVTTAGKAIQPSTSVLPAYVPPTAELLALANEGWDGNWSLSSADPAEALPYGAGCRGSDGNTPTLSADPLHLPWAGDRFDLLVQDYSASSRLGAILLGDSDSHWSGEPLPFDLGTAGLPGCALLAAPDLFLPITLTVGPTTWSVTLAADPALIGLRLFAQAAVQDFAANPAGLVVTNGVALRMGDR